MTEVLARVPKEHRRFYQLARTAFVIAFGVHCGFLVLFLLLGERELALFNVVSVAVWGSALWFHARGRYRHLGGPGLTEIFAHSTLCVLFLGTASGFHFYLLTSIALPFLVPFYSDRLKFVLAGLSSVAFIGLLLWGAMIPPFSSHPDWLLNLFLVGNAAGIAVVIVAVIATYEQTVVRAEVALEEAYDRTESLLHNILPARIAERLKTSRKVVAEGHENVSILFADLVGFTELSARLSPEEVVAFLNQIFSRFDELVGERRLEKIKTIGDAYMVVAGAPEPRLDHAEALVGLALDMLRELEAIGAEKNIGVQLRIGINSGPVVAGVIGTRKLAYDLWGDTVNTAARMEAHGVSGSIQVTLATARLIEQAYRLEPRAPQEIKGKGIMETFLVREALSTPAPNGDASEAPSPASAESSS